MVKAMIVAGVGCRKGASATAIADAIACALRRAGLERCSIAKIATSAAKGAEPGLAAAALSLGVPLVLVPQADLEAASSRTKTHSQRVMALAGVPSVAEAAALAVAGPTARLLTPRIAVGTATCALAASETAP
jgi:cobalt-precorrin 5A hydrolase